jgi:hypothetical protein
VRNRSWIIEGDLDLIQDDVGPGFRSWGGA